MVYRTEFQDSQDYTEKPCLKKQNKRRKKRQRSKRRRRKRRIGRRRRRKKRRKRQEKTQPYSSCRVVLCTTSGLPAAPPSVLNR